MAKKKKDAPTKVATKKRANKEKDTAVSNMDSLQVAQSLMVTSLTARSLGKRFGIAMSFVIGLGGPGYFTYSSGTLDSWIPTGKTAVEAVTAETSKTDMPTMARETNASNPESATAVAEDDKVKPSTEGMDQVAPLETQTAADAPKPALSPVNPGKAVEKPVMKEAVKKVDKDSKKVSVKKKTPVKKPIVKAKEKAASKAKTKKTASK